MSKNGKFAKQGGSGKRGNQLVVTLACIAGALAIGVAYLLWRTDKL